MKLLVTGSKGFIGQNMCNAIHDKGWELATFDIADNPKTRPMDLDYTDVDCVIHLGAISSTTETDVGKLMDQNLAWSIELFDECVARNIQFQFASSASVYGKRLQEDGPFKTTDICNPSNYYAFSKYAFEEYAKKSYANTSWQCLRYFNVYGPHEEHKKTQASPYTQFRKQALETGVIKVFEGSERYKRDFIHVDEIIRMHFHFIDHPKTGIFNAGTGRPRSFLEVAKDIALITGAKIETIPFPAHLRNHYQEYTCAG